MPAKDAVETVKFVVLPAEYENILNGKLAFVKLGCVFKLINFIEWHVTHMLLFLFAGVTLAWKIIS